jgi:nuclear cap-binding protein subunit 2
MAIVRNTVDRLDKPSAYFNSRRKGGRRDDRGRDEEEAQPEPADDPLKDATTLYVGNLYVFQLPCGFRVQHRRR